MWLKLVFAEDCQPNLINSRGGLPKELREKNLLWELPKSEAEGLSLCLAHIYL